MTQPKTTSCLLTTMTVITVLSQKMIATSTVTVTLPSMTNVKHRMSSKKSATKKGSMPHKRSALQTPTPSQATKKAVINTDDLDFDGMVLEEDTKSTMVPTRMPGFF